LDKESYSASIIAALSWQKKEIFTHAKEKDVEQLPDGILANVEYATE
jgi:hypothetical protein